jgi:hypothetical protein
MANFAMRSSCSFEQTPPVGLQGRFRSSSLQPGCQAARSAGSSSENYSAALVATGTPTPCTSSTVGA